jgi:hypothetical protein
LIWWRTRSSGIHARKHTRGEHMIATGKSSPALKRLKVIRGLEIRRLSAHVGHKNLREI